MAFSGYEKQVAQFMKENPNLNIVIEIKEANQSRNRKVFSACLRAIEDHLWASEAIEINADYWDACGCEDCNMWKELYEERLIYV